MKSHTLLAIEAFEAVEKAELQALRKRKLMEQAHVPAEDMAAYYKRTEEIRAEYAAKAEKEGLL